MFYTTYTVQDTIFTIDILETNIIYNIFLNIENISIEAEWYGRRVFKDGRRYSSFRVIYVFTNPIINGKAYFSYSIENTNYVSNKFCFNVENFYDY